MSTATANESPRAAPLRRAKYVTVEEMVLSQYEIDRKRLDDELAKLRAPPQVSTNVDDEDEGYPYAWATRHNQTDLHAGSLRSPLHTKPKHHHSRLQPPRDGFNLCLLVGKFELVVDKCRVDGSRILVAEVEVSDDSGSISLRARDEQIDLLREISDNQGAIVLRNCTMELYQGKYLRLGVSKWGKMSAYPDSIESTPSPPTRINQDLNFSLVNLNVVAKTKTKDSDDPPIPVAKVHHKQQKHRQHNNVEVASRRGQAKFEAHHHQKKKNESQSNQHQQQQQQQQQRRYGSNINVVSGATHSPLHQPRGGAPSPQSIHVPQIYQQYSDAGSLYSYLPEHHDQSRQFLPDPQYSSQQHFIYQQFHDLQQRHAHQMILLQQQQESQFRDFEQAASAHTSTVSDSRAGSFESGVDFPVPASVGGMVPTRRHFNTGVYTRAPVMHSYLPSPHPSPPHQQLAVNVDYQYDSPGRNSLRNEQQSRGNTSGVPTTYASVISPPMSPALPSRSAPQAPAADTRDSET